MKRAAVIAILMASIFATASSAFAGPFIYGGGYRGVGGYYGVNYGPRAAYWGGGYGPGYGYYAGPRYYGYGAPRAYVRPYAYGYRGVGVGVGVGYPGAYGYW